jgi:hypothetical protein
MNNTLESLLANAHFVDTTAPFVQFGYPDETVEDTDKFVATFKTYAISDGTTEIRIRAAEFDGKLFIKYVQSSPRDGKAGKKAGIKIEGESF